MKNFYLDIRHIAVDGSSDKPVMIKPVSPVTFHDILISDDRSVSKEELDTAIRTIYTYFAQHGSSSMTVDIQKIEKRFRSLDRLSVDDIEKLFGYQTRCCREEVK